MLNTTNLTLLGAADSPEAYECANEHCLDEVHPARYALGYKFCLACGDREAVRQRKAWCVAPMHKSNYMLITDKDLLSGLNNKGGLVR